MIIGVDLGGTNITIGAFTEEKFQKRETFSTPSDKNLEESISIFKDTIRPFTNQKVKGIGIGVPSVVDTHKGIVYNVANIPSWEKVYLKDLLEEEFNIPIFLNNDANCFTLGEKMFGEGKPYKNMVGITLGTGVGAGLIIDGNLYEGTNTGAGEIGEFPYLDGIYEHYCASNFFTMNGTNGKIAAEKALHGDQESAELWHQYGKHLGRLIHTVLLAYDPEAIIFGGSTSKAYSLFEKGMNESLEKFPFPSSLEKLDIKITQNPDIALLGAIALVK